MLRKILVFILFICMLTSITAVSAVQNYDTKIVGTNQHRLPNINVKCGENIEIIAELQEYGPFDIFRIDEGWVSLPLRYLDLGVTDSQDKFIHTDKARTRFFTNEAHFGVFKLDNPGYYTCYIKYAGGKKHCQTQFHINVTKN